MVRKKIKRAIGTEAFMDTWFLNTQAMNIYIRG
jgi:hypothetical protein